MYYEYHVFRDRPSITELLEYPEVKKYACPVQRLQNVYRFHINGEWVRRACVVCRCVHMSFSALQLTLFEKKVLCHFCYLKVAYFKIS